jgi:hypothetical protein
MSKQGGQQFLAENEQIIWSGDPEYPLEKSILRSFIRRLFSGMKNILVLVFRKIIVPIAVILIIITGFIAFLNSQFTGDWSMLIGFMEIIVIIIIVIFAMKRLASMLLGRHVPIYYLTNTRAFEIDPRSRQILKVCQLSRDVTVFIDNHEIIPRPTRKRNARGDLEPLPEVGDLVFKMGKEPRVIFRRIGNPRMVYVTVKGEIQRIRHLGPGFLR